MLVQRSYHQFIEAIRSLFVLNYLMVIFLYITHYIIHILLNCIHLHNKQQKKRQTRDYLNIS